MTKLELIDKNELMYCTWYETPVYPQNHMCNSITCKECANLKKLTLDNQVKQDETKNN